MRIDWLIEGCPSDAERAESSVVQPIDGVRLELLDLGRGLDIKRVRGAPADEPLDLHVTDYDSPESLVNLVVPIGTPARVTVPGVDHPLEARSDTHFWHLPEERWADYHIPAGTRIASGSLGLSLEFLADIARGQRLPAPLMELLDRGRSPPFLLGRETGPELRKAVCALHDNPFHGRIETLFAEGKAMEIAAYALAALQAPEPARRPALSDWEVRRLHEARERLVQDPRSPPTVRELAHGVGLPVARLQSGFREVFGAPVFRWLQGYKLDLAREVLETESVPVKELAFRLGYSHQNNFANAFRRRFGVPPGTVRRARVPKT